MATNSYQTSELAENLIGSEIIALSTQIKKLIAGGKKIYNFTIGDFDPQIFPIPSEFEDEIVKAYKNKLTNYPVPNGVFELRESAADFFASRQGTQYEPEEVLVSSGSRPLLYSAFQAIVNIGEKVLFPVPSWNNNHFSYLARAQQIRVESKVENDFLPVAKDLAPFIKESTLLSLCSPLNPTGTAFKPEQLAEICDLVIAENKVRVAENRKPLYVIYDHLYWPLTHGTTQHCTPVGLRPEMKDYTILIDGMSKCFASTGLRIGWAFGPANVLNKMMAILSHIGAWAPRAEQEAAAIYLQKHDIVNNYLKNFSTRVEKRLKACYNGFKALKNEGYNVDAIAPQAAIYLTVKINLKGKTKSNGSKIETAAQTTAFLLDEAGLAVVPFSCFGASIESEWFRIAVGTANMNDIEDCFVQLKKALKTLI